VGFRAIWQAGDAIEDVFYITFLILQLQPFQNGGLLSWVQL
jgi:hypothetical protein